MAEPLLRFRGVARRYGAYWVLQGVDGELTAGSTTALQGENGSGKSTLLLILAYILKAHRGSIEIAANNKVHLVGHHPMAYTQLSIERNLELACVLAGEAPTKIAAALDYWNITALGHKPLTTLSRGQMQRFLLARSLLVQPQVLLLDEPYTGLDAASADLLDRYIREHSQRGGATLIAEHDSKRAARLAQKTLILAAGQIA